MTSTTDIDTPGRLMAAEIAEQPQVWRRLLDEGTDAIAAAAARIAERAPRFVLLRRSRNQRPRRALRQVPR